MAAIATPAAAAPDALPHAASAAMAYGFAASDSCRRLPPVQLAAAADATVLFDAPCRLLEFAEPRLAVVLSAAGA